MPLRLFDVFLGFLSVCQGFTSIAIDCHQVWSLVFDVRVDLLCDIKVVLSEGDGCVKTLTTFINDLLHKIDLTLDTKLLFIDRLGLVYLAQHRIILHRPWKINLASAAEGAATNRVTMLTHFKERLLLGLPEFMSDVYHTFFICCMFFLMLFLGTVRHRDFLELLELFT